MPSKNMLPKGKRRQTVKKEYRAHRDAVREADAAAQQQAEQGIIAAGSDALENLPQADATPPTSALAEPLEFETEDGVRSFTADAAAKGKRLDAYLAMVMPELSRGRVQLLIDHGQVRVAGEPAKASLKLSGGERIEIEGEPYRAPLKAEPEDIPLAIVYEDEDLAVIDKAAGMTVHAGAGDAEHNRGTLVNALLFHFGYTLPTAPAAEGEANENALRPGIVHRLDKETSGLIVVAKNDAAHRRLSEMFATRVLRKVYLALVHGTVAEDEGTVDLPIGRDAVRRTRMTTRRGVEAGARMAVSHWRVLERIGSKENPGPLGQFTLLEVRIETGRTHQIRVHLSAVGHPVVGDTLYGAHGRLRRPATGKRPGKNTGQTEDSEPTLGRNFLHAAELSFAQPRTGETLDLRSPLPAELEQFLTKVGGMPASADRKPPTVPLGKMETR